jgi:hypothetical protein
LQLLQLGQWISQVKMLLLTASKFPKSNKV